MKMHANCVKYDYFKYHEVLIINLALILEFVLNKGQVHEIMVAIVAAT